MSRSGAGGGKIDKSDLMYDVHVHAYKVKESNDFDKWNEYNSVAKVSAQQKYVVGKDDNDNDDDNDDEHSDNDDNAAQKNDLNGRDSRNQNRDHHRGGGRGRGRGGRGGRGGGRGDHRDRRDGRHHGDRGGHGGGSGRGDVRREVHDDGLNRNQDNPSSAFKRRGPVAVVQSGQVIRPHVPHQSLMPTSARGGSARDEDDGVGVPARKVPSAPSTEMLPNAKSFFIVKGRLLGGVDDVLGLLHADLRHNRNTNGDVFRNVVLLGDVGCGRTTVARAFCRMMRAEGIVADDTLTELSARNDAYNFTNLVLSAPEGGVLVTEAADMLPTHVGMLATLHARKRHVIVISDTKAQLENWWQADQCGDACAGWLERTISLPSWPATRCLAMLVDRICDIDFVDKDDAVRTLDNALVDATISPRFRNARDVVRLSEALRARRGPISKEIVRDIVKDFIAPFIVARVDRRIELAAAAPANNDAVPMVPDELPEDDIAPLVPPAMFDIAVAPAAVCVSSDAPPELRQRHNKPYEDSPLCPSDMYEIMKI